MTPDLLLFDADGSPCGRRVKITLWEKALPFRTHALDLAKLEQRRPEYLAINPNGLVPALAHDGFVIWESNVITEYLDDAFPERPLYPQDPRERAAAKKWQAVELALAKPFRALMYARLLGPILRFAADLEEVLERARRATTDPDFLHWEEKVWRLEVLDDNGQQAASEELQNYLQRVERALESTEYLVGDRFSTADISMFPRIRMYPLVGIDLDSRYPNILRWSRRLSKRTSFSKTEDPMNRILRRLERTGILQGIRNASRRRAGTPALSDRILRTVVRPILRRQMGFGITPRTATKSFPIVSCQRPPDAPAWRGRSQPRGRVILHGDPFEVETEAVLLALRHAGIAFDPTIVDGGLLQQCRPDQLRRNPTGALPFLSVDGEDVVELLAIVERLVVLSGDEGLLGTTAQERARVRMWCAYDAGMHKEFRPLFFRHVVRPRLRARYASSDELLAALPPDLNPSDLQWILSVWDDRIRIDMGQVSAESVMRGKLDRLESELSERDFIAGSSGPSFADLLLACRMRSLPHIGIPWDETTHPRAHAWTDRVLGKEPMLEAAPAPESDHEVGRGLRTRLLAGHARPGIRP